MSEPCLELKVLVVLVVVEVWTPLVVLRVSQEVLPAAECHPLPGQLEELDLQQRQVPILPAVEQPLVLEQVVEQELQGLH